MGPVCQSGGRTARKRRGAVVAAIEALEERRLLAAPISFLDHDGDQVTVQLTGGGTVLVQGAVRNVELSGTKPSSVLTITVQRAVGGDGLVTLGEIRADGPMLTITAPNADFTHEITVNDTNEAVSPTSKVSMTLGALQNLAMYTGGQRIATLSIADWSTLDMGQELNAPSIDTFIVTGRSDVPGTTANEALPGNSGEIMILGDGSTTANDYSIGTMRVAGVMGDVQATGRVGAIITGQIDGHLRAASYRRIRVRAVPGSSVATGTVTGKIVATGAPGVSMSIGIIRTDSDVTTLKVIANQGDIGFISVGGGAQGLVTSSAGGISEMDVVDGLGASRIQSQGNIGTISVGSMGDVAISVGVVLGAPMAVTSAAAFSNVSATLGVLRITGSTQQAATDPLITGANTLSAAKVRRLVLRRLDSPSAMQMHVLDRQSPSVVRDIELDPTASFFWHNGDPVPQALAAMLHRV